MFQVQFQYVLTNGNDATVGSGWMDAVDDPFDTREEAEAFCEANTVYFEYGSRVVPYRTPVYCNQLQN